MSMNSTTDFMWSLRRWSASRALAGGLAFDAIPFVSVAAWCLFAASLVATVNVIRIVRYAFLTPSSARL
jgi:hypothetical protein